MTDRITYAEAAELLKLPYTTLRAFRKRIGAPEPVVVTSGTQPALFSKREYEEFMLDHNVAALIAAERYFDKHGVYPNQGDAKPSFNKLASTFLKGAYLTQAARAKREAMMAIAKRNKPKTTRVTVESDWAWKAHDNANTLGRIRSTTTLKPNGMPTGIAKTQYDTFRAKIKFNKVEYNLGCFDTLDKAIDARVTAEKQLRDTGKLSNATSAMKKSLPKGVQLRPNGTYVARMKCKSIDYNLGTFKTLEEAVAVRREAEKQIKQTGRVK
jgi:hypothetical protein